MICTFNNNKQDNSSMNRKSPIKPPRSNQHISLNDGNPTYSLFDSTSPSQYWLRGTKVQDISTTSRKHSVSVDGSDSLFSSKYENNDASFWRRASLPNNYGFMMSSYSCSACNLPFCFNTDFLQTNCEHSICRSCVNPNSSFCPLCLTKGQQESNLSGSLISSSIIADPLRNKPAFNSLEVPKTDDSYSNISPSSASDLIYPGEEDEAYYIGDLLLSKSLDVSFTKEQVKNSLCCVKLTNIPWDISQNDVKLFFGNEVELPCSTVYAQSIHIMMDRTTGKTLSHCYVEFSSIQEALKAIQYGNQKSMKGRIINVTLCPIDELLSVTFPSWQSGFTGSKANTSFVDNSPNNCFITREEINSLLIICKSYKLHFSRKCAERPFENIISIVTKYPWEQHELVSSAQKDEIFELLKLSIDVLKIHLAKEFIQIDRSLLERMVRAGVLCPSFTDFQKSILLQTADMCPADTKSLNSQEQVNLTSRIDDIRLDNSYVHITPNYNKDVTSLLNILNQSAAPQEPKEDVFTKNVLSSLFNENLKEYSGSNSSSFSSGSESDEDSYCFCEKEDENDEEFLIF